MVDISLQCDFYLLDFEVFNDNFIDFNFGQVEIFIFFLFEGIVIFDFGDYDVNLIVMDIDGFFDICQAIFYVVDFMFIFEFYSEFDFGNQGVNGSFYSFDVCIICEYFIFIGVVLLDGVISDNMVIIICEFCGLGVYIVV